MSEEFNAEVSEDNLSARLSGGAIHALTDALVSCFKGSGAINHLECSFEDPDNAEQYTMLMQKKSGITQGEKIDRLQQENAELREALKRLVGKGIDLLNIEDVEDEEDAASIHSNFNDEIICAELLLDND